MPGPLVVAALLVASPLGAQRPAPRKVPVGDGILLFITAPYSNAGLDGNSVVIRSRDGVLVWCETVVG